MRSLNPAPSDHGFTLVEVLVALGLVTMCLSTVGALLGLSIRTAADARERIVATLLARQKLEILRLTPSLDVAPLGALDANIAGFFDIVDSTGQPADQVPASRASRLYLRRWTVGSSTIAEVTIQTIAVLVVRAGTLDGRVFRTSSAVHFSTARLPR